MPAAALRVALFYPQGENFNRVGSNIFIYFQILIKIYCQILGVDKNESINLKQVEMACFTLQPTSIEFS